MPAQANPQGPHHLYTYSWRGKVFYIGISHPAGARPALSWHHVTEDLIGRFRREGSLPANKWSSYNRLCNRVIAAIYLSASERHDVDTTLWQGIGRPAAEAEETRQILLHHEAGCVLANIAKMPRADGKIVRNSLVNICTYLGLPSGAHLLAPEGSTRASSEA